MPCPAPLLCSYAYTTLPLPQLARKELERKEQLTSRLPPSARRLFNCLAPARHEDCEKITLLGGFHCQRRQRHGNSKGNVVADRARCQGAAVSRVRAIDPDGGLQQTSEAVVV